MRDAITSSAALLSESRAGDYLAPVRTSIRLGLALLILLPVALAAQLEPPSTGGYAALDQRLRMLGHDKRVLMIAAHPDDEDTELLTLLVRGMGAEAAYLSLNRGEGGQNLIGSELGEALGLLRTEELLAARRLDGARQFFTRAYDFGFSKNLDDTWAHWPRDSVLKDVVRTIRRFRPEIVVSIFSGTPRDGHGQHQAAGWAAQEAFRLAGDPTVFPELGRDEGLAPFTPLKLYRSARFDTAATTLTLDGGALDPAVGQSFHQIAMRGRSLHRSQDMGQLQGLGPSAVRLALLQDRTGAGSGGLWDGIDTTLGGVPLLRSLRGPSLARSQELLSRYVARVDSARLLIATPMRARLRDLLARAGDDLAQARRQVADGVSGSGRAELAGLPDGDPFDGEGRRLRSAQLAGFDVISDAVSEDARVVPGQRVAVTLSVWNPGSAPAPVSLCLDGVELGWKLAGDSAGRGGLSGSSRRGTCLGYRGASGSLASLGESHDSLPPGRLIAARVEATVPESEDYSTPYFLRLPRQGDLYQWDPEDRSVWGLPFEPARFRLTSGEADTREITFRGNDQGSGEFRKPVMVVPRVDVHLEPDLEVWPASSRAARTFVVTLTHGSRDTTGGVVQLHVPSGWAVPPAQRFRLTREDERAEFRFIVRPPEHPAAGAFEVSAVALTPGGQAYDVGLRTVDHPHIRARTRAVRAAAVVRVTDLVLPRTPHIAYLRGAADRLPEALQSVGLPLELITGADLASRPLGRYGVIVVGPRAWETDAELPANNDQLLAYARAGGTVIVQYQQYAYFLGGFAPYPMTVGSRAPGAPNAGTTVTRPGGPAAAPALLGGHDRVTDENAPVTVLDPGSPILRIPNRIGPADWRGWVQERGLYFAHSWDPQWKPVVEMHDPGEGPLEGGLLVARVGRGTYVYTGVSFFRQLPAGVPGAWRLFANLLALGQAAPARPSHAGAVTDTLKVERE